MNASELIDTLREIGFDLAVDGVNLRFQYTGACDPPATARTLLDDVRQRKAEVLDYLRMLETPQAELKEPLLIESAYLKDTLYLVANEFQAEEIEKAGGVPYLPGEIRSLVSLHTGMYPDDWKFHLTKIHEVKKVFRGARLITGLG